MIKFLSAIFLTMTLSFSVMAKEVITLYTYSGPASTFTQKYRTILEVANTQQDRFIFQLDPRPGANGLLAIKAMQKNPHNSLSTVSASLIELINTSLVTKDNLIPVFSGGEACYAIAAILGDSNKGLISLKGVKEIKLVTIAIGSSAHMALLELGSDLGFSVVPVVFKSQVEGLVLMAGDQSVDLIIESPRVIKNFQTKNPNIRPLAMNCKTRNPKMPEVSTAIEQNFDLPGLWSFAVANSQMDPLRRETIAGILQNALVSIGQSRMFDLYDIQFPTLQGLTVNQHFDHMYTHTNKLHNKWSREINAQK